MEEKLDEKDIKGHAENVRKEESPQQYDPQASQAYPPTPYYPYYNYYGQPQTPQESAPGAEASTMACPTCGKPGYISPYPQKKSVKDKKFLKIPVIAWVVILFIVILFSCAIVAWLSLTSPGGNKKVIHEEVIIAHGGHFKYTLGYSLDDKISFNISSQDGSNFDVYIMDEDQYENAYGSGSSRIISFSSQYSSENVNAVSENLDFSDEDSRYMEYYLIIDNRDTGITPDDASPMGTITIDVHITIDYTYYYM
jgi:hypothetical protein